jgi:hypothetical protein
VIKKFASISLMCLMGALIGCASQPSFQEMRSELATFHLPKVPENGMALIYVVRPYSFGGLVRFNVFLDNQHESSEVGYTRANQYIYFAVVPGKHRLFSKAENWAEASVNLAAGEIAYFQQVPTLGVMMVRNDLYRLDDTHGRYHVKNLSLGTIARATR